MQTIVHNRSRVRNAKLWSRQAQGLSCFKISRDSQRIPAGVNGRVDKRSGPLPPRREQPGVGRG